MSEQDENKLINHAQYKIALRFLELTHAGFSRHAGIDPSTSFKYANGRYVIPKRISDIIKSLMDGQTTVSFQNSKRRRRG